jgi:plastocyanin
MRLKRFGAGLVLVALVVGLAGCGGDDDDDGRSLGGRGTADVVAKSEPKPHFDPDELQARVGDEVSFSLKNEGDRVHNFTLSFLGIDQDVQPGQTIEIRFRVSEPPKGIDFFTFYDKNFQGEGMQGRLNVER